MINQLDNRKYFFPSPPIVSFLLSYPFVFLSIYPPTLPKHTYSGCRAGFQGNVLAGAIAIPGRAAIRGTDDQEQLPKHQVNFRRLGEKLSTFG